MEIAQQVFNTAGEAIMPNDQSKSFHNIIRGKQGFVYVMPPHKNGQKSFFELIIDDQKNWQETLNRKRSPVR